jgi:DNA-binding NtrC family response regulator
LFLDEIDALPPAAQVKLLRFLQDREVRPLGSSKARPCDVRTLAASNANLEESMRAGRFRQDRYYRLNVIPIVLPPLRQRAEDIPLLARHFLAKYVAAFRRPIRDFAPQALLKLAAFSWPGNVRELENVVERAVVLCDQPTIRAEHLLLSASGEVSGEDSFQRLKAEAIDQFERRYLQESLTACDGNISKAVRLAGKNRRAFWELIRKHRLAVQKPALAHPAGQTPARSRVPLS